MITLFWSREKHDDTQHVRDIGRMLIILVLCPKRRSNHCMQCSLRHLKLDDSCRTWDCEWNHVRPQLICRRSPKDCDHGSEAHLRGAVLMGRRGQRNPQRVLERRARAAERCEARATEDGEFVPDWGSQSPSRSRSPQRTLRPVVLRPGPGVRAIAQSVGESATSVAAVHPA